MINKSRVHGYIEVELNKKHGKRILLHENMLTQFGKSVVIGNGLGGIFTEGSNKTLNRIKCIGTRDYVADKNYPIGPYLTGSASTYTDGSKITNLLLNNPQLSSDTGLYIPDDNTLAGYAARDKASSGSLKEGTVAYVKDSQDRIRRLVRRFEYPTDLACEFNTIAMATMTPTGTTGRVIPMYRNVNPFVYNASSMSSFIISEVGLHKIKDGLVSYKAADGKTYTVSCITGKIEEGGTVQTGYNKSGIISVFTKGNYTYVVRALRVNSSGGTTKIGYDVLDTDGNTVYSTSFSAGVWASGYSYGMVYYEGEFYFVYGENGRWYKLVDTGNGYMEYSIDTYITAPITLPTATFSVTGSDSSGFTTYQFSLTYVSASGYSLPRSLAITNSSYAKVGNSIAYTGCLFSVGHQVLSFGYAETKEYDWAPKLESLIEYGNLISYHTLDQPIQKSVGDSMFITYSYVID